MWRNARRVLQKINNQLLNCRNEIAAHQQSVNYMVFFLFFFTLHYLNCVFIEGTEPKSAAPLPSALCYSHHPILAVVFDAFWKEDCSLLWYLGKTLTTPPPAIHTQYFLIDEPASVIPGFCSLHGPGGVHKKQPDHHLFSFRLFRYCRGCSLPDVLVRPLLNPRGVSRQR